MSRLLKQIKLQKVKAVYFHLKMCMIIYLRFTISNLLLLCTQGRTDLVESLGVERRFARNWSWRVLRLIGDLVY